MEGADHTGHVKEHTYRETFSREFNLHFSQPRSDTGSICDSIKVEIAAWREIPRDAGIIDEAREDLERKLKKEEVKLTLH